MIEKGSQQYALSPAYDLLNTKIHVDDTSFALQKGLSEQESSRSIYYRNHGQPTQNDFLTFAQKIGIDLNTAQAILEPFLEKQPLVEIFLERFFLSKGSKNAYLIHYNNKRKQLEKKG